MHYDLVALTPALARLARQQGRLDARLALAGFELGQGADLAMLAAMAQDAIKTSEIEGEVLNAHSVRSSLARRMGVDIGALAPADRQVDGVVDMLLDATGNPTSPLTLERLLGWHAALFPTGYSGLSPIRTGALRDDGKGPMQVVSGPVNRRKVHFEAPAAPALAPELGNFLAWAAAPTQDPPLVKAGLAHLWLVTLHPFDDGNGRIARAVGDLFLARADSATRRFYSLSAQIQRQRKHYYDVLERTQKGDLEVTEWLAWFLAMLEKALAQAHLEFDLVLAKASYWQRWAGVPINARQSKLLNRLLDGFDGKLTSGKWAAIAKCSSDTALRDINELVAKGMLAKDGAGGRSTGYVVALG